MQKFPKNAPEVQVKKGFKGKGLKMFLYQGKC